MITLGIRKETKNHENRVALVPGDLCSLDSRDLHSLDRVTEPLSILVEESAGKASGYSDGGYLAGYPLNIVSRKKLFELSNVIVGVKELDDAELASLREDQVDVCFQHFAAHDRTAKCKQVAFEEYCVNDSYPILKSMSIIAGKLSILEGFRFLLNNNGGHGVLYDDANVLVVGAGVVGINAAVKAKALGASVAIVDKNQSRLDLIGYMYPGLELYNSFDSLWLDCYDIVVGSAYVPKSKAPKIIDTKLMKEGSVLVDVSIDQGGSADSSRPTTHDEPTYVENGVIHYCVPNIPGIVGRSASRELSQEVVPLITKVLKDYSTAVI